MSWSCTMSFALLYVVVRLLLDALLTRRESDLRLRAEVLALRNSSASSIARSVVPLAAGRSPPPERPEPLPATLILVISARQPRRLSSDGTAIWFADAGPPTDHSRAATSPEPESNSTS